MRLYCTPPPALTASLDKNTADPLMVVLDARVFIAPRNQVDRTIGSTGTPFHVYVTSALSYTQCCYL